MRLLIRTRADVIIWPRAVSAGALGGVTEGFSAEGIPAKASVSYVNNTLNGGLNALVSTPYGARAAQAIRLRFLKGTAIEVGDGVSLSGEGAPAWRCVQVDSYPFLTVARIERIAE